MKTLIEPFKIKSVEEIPITTREQRENYLHDAFYNPFFLRSEHVTIDLLTDSGTTAMSSKQWAGLMDGDEAYAGSRSYYKFENAVINLTGYKHIIPTHQGRAAEKILFTLVAKPGITIPSNSHFDTTRGNIEYQGADAVDNLVNVGMIPEAHDPFKGNMDINKLRELIIERGPENIPLCMLTVTNNTAGGQPVSMQNIKETKALCKEYGIPLILDACRFAENAYFIKSREKGYENKTIREIAQEMFSYCDGATMSAKKDGLSNTGGFLALNDDELAEKAKVLLIIMEGFLTYGGMTRRDLEALAQGFEEVLDEHYLEYRIGQIKYLGNKLLEAGVPILEPTGGHAVYLDAKRFVPHIPPHNLPGQSVLCELYLVGGVRSVEIGSLMFGKKDANGNHIAPPMELVRMAIPRRVYTQAHTDYVAEACIETYQNRSKLRGMRIAYEAKYLRHFTAKLEYV
ncbi:MAG: tryptophanase [Candidatus Kapabacteria bacterium]|nr:tryptophanase [Ignavibacteriota bacterium]MCW5884643.1 tryptophanase [Candidatus Kapabacteria bacterium]